MPDRLSKEFRKQQLAALRKRQRADSRAELPMSNERMQALFDYLDKELGQHACDHTLHLVEKWAGEQTISFERLAKWCRATGGYCDCEVLANSEEHWRDAIHEEP